MAENGAPRPLEHRVDDLETSIRTLRELVGELYVDVKAMQSSMETERLVTQELRRTSEAQRDSIKLLAVYADRLLKTSIDHEERITGLENQS